MIKTIIEEVFHTKDFTLHKMDKGLTNHNFLLIVNHETFVVRVPHEDSEHIINRKHEKQVSEIVKNLDVETIYFNEENGIKITRYIEGLEEYENSRALDKVERCATLMKQLHSLPNVSFCFDPFQTLNAYKARVQHPLYDLHSYDIYLEKVKHLNNPHVLCHNDFVSGNILYGRDRDYLIDYEYAGSNDPLFDVTSFLSENQIFDETLRERFYATYFIEMNDTIREQLYLWEIFHNVLWCYWAMMMYESRNEEVYKQIAADKYNALQRMEH